MYRSTLALIAVALVAAPASAQSLGTFTWQLQPYCNVVTVHVTGIAGVYTLEGFDDQCGAGTRAPLTGVATPNPDGTIGFGMNLVTSPGGRGIQVEARIALASLSGPWTDGEGNTGTFAFNQRTGGSPRPLPVSPPVIPLAFGLQGDGGFVAGGTVGSGAIPRSGAGARMMWFPNKFAFRAGAVSGTQWDDQQIGGGSVAFGYSNVASGADSFAHGTQSSATAFAATALGVGVVASGEASFAAGSFVTASGRGSLAFGSNSKATGSGAIVAGLDSVSAGDWSVAAGRNVLAGGESSVAIGNLLDVAGEGAVALGHNAGTTIAGRGSFLFGDRSSNSSFMQAFAPNQFLVRAVGGAKFFTNPSLNSGVMLATGASSWSSLSDANSKENFRDLDNADLLATIAAMPIRQWNYKAQDASIRHVGPTAQDFHAAFGLGEDPLRISTIDADGIALAGVSALARENTARAKENQELREALASTSADLAALRAELAALRESATAVSPRR
jgi:Chaperone of endosialidase